MQTLSLPIENAPTPIQIDEGEHLVARFEGPEDGPKIIIIGSIHGNEQSGVRALRKVAEEIERQQPKINGEILFLAGNTRAIQKNQRYIDFDLNRHWTEENVRRNSPNSSIKTSNSEDIEQTELLILIEDILKRARNEVYAVDLHSTSSESEPFAMIGDTLRNRAFARKFPVTLLLGIEEQIEGTVMEYLGGRGAITIGYEAGQHTKGVAFKNQEAFVWGALFNSGVLTEEIDHIEWYDSLEATAGLHGIVEVRHRHGIEVGDQFEMNPGYENFQFVKKGEHLANDKRGPVKAVESGLILLPLYQSLGNDGFFLGRRISPTWLRVSRMMRKAGLAELVRWLPGVSELDENVLAVNTRVARVLPLQLFHLLGFRKRRWKNDRLIVSKRRYDRTSPFKQNDGNQ